MDLNRRSVLAGAAAAGTGSLAGCFGDDAEDDCPTLPQEPAYAGWLEKTSNYSKTCDFRGQDTAEVTVGVKANNAYWGFGPAAIAVTPETTVTWTWNGRGGSHDVVELEDRFDSGTPADSGSKTFEVTFDTPGVYKYFCTPHRSQDMKGAVFVALE